MSSRGTKRSRSRSPNLRARSQSPRKWRKPDRRGSDRVDRRDGHVRIYVSNLPYELKWQELKDLFKEKVGNDVTYAQLYEEVDGKPSGAGHMPSHDESMTRAPPVPASMPRIVEVKNRESAKKAIEELDRHEVRKRKIIVREEREKDRIRHNHDMDHQRNDGMMGGGGGGGNFMGGGPNMMSGGGGNRGFTFDWMSQLGIDVTQITNQVFIANLDYKVTKSKLEEVFRMAGNVIDAEIKVDKEGKSRGMGVVRFEHPIEAVQAISLFTNQYLYDRQLFVRMDRWVEPIMQDIPPRLPSGLRGIGVGMGSQGQPLLNIGEIANTLTLSMLIGQTNAQQNMNSSSNNMPMNHSVQPNANLSSGILNNVNNLNNLVNPGVNLGNALGQTGGGLSNQLLGQQSGTGNMVTQTAQAILSSLGLSALTGLGGLDLGANLGGGGGGTGGVLGLGGSGMGIGGSNDIGHSLLSQNMSFNTGQNTNYDARDQLSSMSYDRGGPGEISSIFIKNLPYTFTTGKMYEKFRDFGDVKFAEVKLDSSGRSRGCGIVQYYNADSARRAICLVNGSKIDGRQVEVRLDRLM